MTNATPMLRPSPMDISGLFSGAFQALRSRLGLFLLLVLFPTLLWIVVALLTSVTMGGAFAANPRNPNGGLLFLGVLILLVGAVVVWLAQLKVFGMISLGAYEIAQGQRPDFRGLMARTKGYLPRFIVLVLLGAAAAVVVSLLIGLLVAGAVSSASNGNNGAAGALGLLLVVIYLALIPVAIFLATRWLYVVPVIAIEQASGIPALKRSWNLTKGAFWRTLGYSILPALAVAAVSYAIYLVSAALLTPFAAQGSGNSGSVAVTGLLTAAPIVLFITLVMQAAVQLFSLPFLQSYTTYMYVDQVRRKEFGQQYPQQGQQYPQQGQQYPPQQYPVQGGQYPQQGQQYPVQGQQYPQQGQQFPQQGQYPQQGQQYPPPGGQYPPQQQYPAQGQQVPPQQEYPAQDQQVPPAGQQQPPSNPQQGQNQWGQNPGQSQPPTPSS